MVVFPAPVGPTIATLEPGSTVRLNPWITSLPGVYPKRTSLNSTLPEARPMSGASGEGGISSIERIPKTLSDADATDCILATMSAISATGWLNLLT